MVDLTAYDIREENRQSSKGNQMKWFRDDTWYKADYTGYEGLAEYLVSSLLDKSNLRPDDYILYDTEKIKYQYAEYTGCKSKNFLPEGWQMITLERLFMNTYGESLNRSITTIQSIEERIRFVVDQVERITGLENFGTYLVNLLTIDAFFLNEDRHNHNIAVLIDEKGLYRYCPIFDNGGCLLSDTSVDYPLTVETEILMKNVRPKTFCMDFDEQLDAAEGLYKTTLKFDFDIKDVEAILNKEPFYSYEAKKRALAIIRNQRRKYQYLF